MQHKNERHEYPWIYRRWFLVVCWLHNNFGYTQEERSLKSHKRKYQILLPFCFQLHSYINQKKMCIVRKPKIKKLSTHQHLFFLTGWIINNNGMLHDLLFVILVFYNISCFYIKRIKKFCCSFLLLLIDEIIYGTRPCELQTEVCRKLEI